MAESGFEKVAETGELSPGEAWFCGHNETSRRSIWAEKGPPSAAFELDSVAEALAKRPKRCDCKQPVTTRRLMLLEPRFWLAFFLRVSAASCS